MTHIKYPDGMDAPVPHDSSWQAEALRQNALLYNAMLATAKAEAKLAKAVEALQAVLEELFIIGVMGQHQTALQAAEKGLALLAELEKTE